MISFVWSSKYPFMSGAGGSENYTAGQVRELMRRGIPVRILTLGHGTRDGRTDFPDITFVNLPNKEALSELDDTLIFVTYPLDVRTKRPAYAILHCPPPSHARGDSQYNLHGFKNKRLITTSKFAAGMWRRYLKGTTGRMHTVYPFAETAFSRIPRPSYSGDPARILFAGRLTPDKGIYTLLAALHMDSLRDIPLRITATTAGKHTAEGKIIYKLLKAHPQIQVEEACHTSAQMARLMANHDVIVNPSTNIFWQEMFGIVSIEAQHAGCRVVASRSGGLPETSIGGLLLVRPDDPKALAAGVAKAALLGPLTAEERAFAGKHFTVEASVDALLRTIGYPQPRRTSTLFRGAAKLAPGGSAL